MFTVPLEYQHLPTAKELPDSDETPVDNELQNDIPNILLNLLRDIWGDRFDWFWGVDMAVYYEPDLEKPKNSKAVVPDGFLALGVPRHIGEGGRLSYAIWEEKVLPILFFEVISKKYNDEYKQKLELYEKLGIRYYVIYNPLSGRRGKHKERSSLEVYQLIDGKYELMPAIALLPEGGEMVWLEGVGLGIGCVRNELYDWRREWLYWYDRNGVRYRTAKEQAVMAEAIAERERNEKLQERQEKEKLAAYLRSLGINPDDIP